MTVLRVVSLCSDSAMRGIVVFCSAVCSVVF